MKKFKLLSLLLIITLLAGVLSVPALAVDEPVTAAQCVVLMDADTGNILYEKNADMTFGPNVLTTFLTAAVVGDSLSRQDIGLNDVVTASNTFRYNLAPDYTTVDPAIMPGENLTVEQLLYLTVVASAQDAANILAEYVYGSPDAFAAEMNRKAQELGCVNSNFINAGGTNADAQYSTARDLALITRAALQNPVIRPLFQATSYTVPATDLSAPRTLTGANRLLNTADGQYYQYAYAGKTATTGLGSHLIAAATYNDLDVIAIVIGCPEGTDRFAETSGLFDWVFANYGFRTLVNSTDTLDTVAVAMGNPSEVGVRADTDIRVVMANDQEPSGVETQLVYQHETDGTQLEAPLNVGEYLGDVSVYMNGELQGTARLVTASAVEISRMEYLQNQLNVLMNNPSVRQIITILLVVLGIYILLVVFYLIQRIAHLRSLRRARKERAIAHSQQELEWLDIPEADEPAPFLPQQEQPFYEDSPAPEDAPAEEPEGEYPPDEYAGEGDAPQQEGEYPPEGEAAPEGEYADEGEYVEEGEYPDEGEYADEGKYVEEGEYPDEGEYVEEDEDPQDQN